MHTQDSSFLAAEQAADGTGGALAMANRIGGAIAENTTLLHLDLSNNNFGARQLAALASLMQQNHSLIGLHLSHPHAYVDAHGFVRIVGGTDGADMGTLGGTQAQHSCWRSARGVLFCIWSFEFGIAHWALGIGVDCFWNLTFDLCGFGF